MGRFVSPQIEMPLFLIIFFNKALRRNIFSLSGESFASPASDAVQIQVIVSEARRTLALGPSVNYLSPTSSSYLEGDACELLQACRYVVISHVDVSFQIWFITINDAPAFLIKSLGSGSARLQRFSSLQFTRHATVVPYCAFCTSEGTFIKSECDG